MSRYKRDAKLEPFVSLYYDLRKSIQAELEKMSKTQLTEVIEAARNTTRTNCGWATYKIAPLVADEAQDLLEHREMDEEARERVGHESA